MNRFKNLLLIVDMQNDFCRSNGALYVRGAEGDVKRLVKFMEMNRDKIDHIVLTMDHHQVVDISHPVFWADQNGNHPSPFTEISPDDIQEKKWQPLFHYREAIGYVEALSEQGEFPHIIWPEHCIAGSEGAAITNALMEQIMNWARPGRYYELVMKGTNPLTEHFGILRANIPIRSDPKTMLNMNLVNTLKKYENIFIAGEARSHCVANTVKQMLEITEMVKKLIIIWDTMSDVPGFEKPSLPIYQRAFRQGANRQYAAEIQLS